MAAAKGLGTSHACKLGGMWGAQGGCKAPLVPWLCPWVSLVEHKALQLLFPMWPLGLPFAEDTSSSIAYGNGISLVWMGAGNMLLLVFLLTFTVPVLLVIPYIEGLP